MTSVVDRNGVTLTMSIHVDCNDSYSDRVRILYFGLWVQILLARSNRDMKQQKVRSE